MEQREAIALIRAGVTGRGGVWADLGAGAGTFTRALAALLGPDGTVYAVDRDAGTLGAIARPRDGAGIHAIVGDFTRPLTLPPLDGVVLANALHYVAYDQQARVLRAIGSHLVSGGRLVVVEYERRDANPWVPYPTPLAMLAAAARDAGLGAPTVLATRPSRFGGGMYAATLTASAASAA